MNNRKVSHTRRTRFIVISLVSLSVIIVLVSAFNTSLAQGSPSVLVDNAIVSPQQTNLGIASGAEMYLYGFSTGGVLGSSTFSGGQYVDAVNAIGNIAADLAITGNNTNSFFTATGLHTIAGVGVSGFKSYSSSYGINETTGSGSASDTFNVTTSGDTVVVIAIGGSSSFIRISGIPNLQIDAKNTNASGWVNYNEMPIIIGSAQLTAGKYTVTELTQGNSTQNDSALTHMADLLGVYVFTPGTPSTYTVTFRETGLPKGTAWGVTMDNGVGGKTSSATSFTVSGLKGIYDQIGGNSYTVNSVTGYSSSSYGGSVTSSNGNSTITINFYPLSTSNQTEPTTTTNWLLFIVIISVMVSVVAVVSFVGGLITGRKIEQKK